MLRIAYGLIPRNIATMYEKMFELYNNLHDVSSSLKTAASWSTTLLIMGCLALATVTAYYSHAILHTFWNTLVFGATSFLALYFIFEAFRSIFVSFRSIFVAFRSILVAFWSIFAAFCTSLLAPFWQGAN